MPLWLRAWALVGGVSVLVLLFSGASGAAMLLLLLVCLVAVAADRRARG